MCGIFLCGFGRSPRNPPGALWGYYIVVTLSTWQPGIRLFSFSLLLSSRRGDQPHHPLCVTFTLTHIWPMYRRYVEWLIFSSHLDSAYPPRAMNPKSPCDSARLTSSARKEAWE